MTHRFENVTLLITHYNRSSSLQRLLERFVELDCEFSEIIVSDDGSSYEHQQVLNVLRQKFQFKLLSSDVNKGLGNNLNKGQDGVQTPLVLYVQEDFIPTELFPECLEASVGFMDEDSDLDMVRYYAYFKYPFLKDFNGKFKTMIFSAWPFYWGYRKFYFYSDHPHLRRRNFFERFGRYVEGQKGDVTEYKMMMSVLKNKGSALFYEDFQELFEQKNSETEPSTMKRNFWRETDNLLITTLRHMYRHFKFNFDFHLR